MKRHSSLIVIVLLLLIVLYLAMREPTEVVVTEVVTEQVPVPVERVEPRVPEYRDPPYKTYKPPYYQQMGLLMGPENKTLPLWGRPAMGYRDRYNYYTTTSGEQIFPLPIYHQDRDCTEDIGCPEFYGGEQVSVLSQTGDYEVSIYRNVMQQLGDFF